MAAHCHCHDCQRSTGAQMSTIAGVPKDSFSVLQGEARAFDTTGNTGGVVSRYFCSNCGSTLYSYAHAVPDLMFIEAGCMDDASFLEPSMHMYTESAQPWANLPRTNAERRRVSDLETFSGGPQG